jgi:predicted ribosome quality control (RQC) complex YloA/Tae2 family protein
MGKHSNIIFCDGDDQIIDSIKHVSGQMSSVREVLPGRPYFIPSQEGKQDPWTVTEEVFLAAVFTKPVKLQKAIYTSFVGLSPVIATELADRADLDGDFATASVSEEKRHKLYQVFADFMEDLRQESFSPCLYLDPATQKPAEFAPVDLTMYRDYQRITDASISRILETYYARKNRHTVMHQKSTDLRKIVSIHLERNRKKYQLQKKQLEDTEKKDRYRIYGEMLHTYGYEAVPGAKEITVTNYYDGQTLTIPLDPTLTALENAKKYFDKYGKLKRTADALSTYLQETAHQITHLESIGAALDLAENEADLNAIKTELQDYGFIKKHAVSKRNRPEKSKPLHFVDPNGFHMYVGKNNYQNDQLTFKFASGGDWWFHAKNIPGSHVIVRSEGKELPDATFEAAAALAAYYSSGRDNDKVEIDYLLRKDVKKPNSAPPGFVIYYTNYSMVATPAIAGLEQVD